MFLHRLAKRRKHDALLRQNVLMRRRDGNAVKHRIHSHARQAFLLSERDPQLLEGLENFRIDLVKTVELRPLLWRRVVTDGLVIDRIVVRVTPMRLLHREPVPVRLQAPLQ